jgi:hypothetical protein
MDRGFGGGAVRHSTERDLERRLHIGREMQTLRQARMLQLRGP